MKMGQVRRTEPRAVAADLELFHDALDCFLDILLKTHAQDSVRNVLEQQAKADCWLLTHWYDSMTCLL